MKTIKPLKLKPGDKVGIISPSGPVVFKKKLRLRVGIRELERLGLKVVLGKNVFRKYGGYMAGTIRERIDDLHAMFKNRQIKAIFTSRGGFCANQLLPYIDFSLIKKNPKIILGFSDISVLLNAIYAKTGLITFHGVNMGLKLANSIWEEFTRDYFVKAFFHSKPIGRISGSTSWKILRGGRARGRLLGGNLSVLRTLLGTKYSPDWQGAILFWEDCDITYEDLDHFLTHMKLAGVFDKINGMIIGKLYNIKKIKARSEIAKLSFFSPEKIILERTNGYKFPVISNVSFGHHCEQITIPVGIKATIDTSKKLFSIDESGVK